MNTSKEPISQFDALSALNELVQMSNKVASTPASSSLSSSSFNNPLGHLSNQKYNHHNHHQHQLQHLHKTPGGSSESFGQALNELVLSMTLSQFNAVPADNRLNLNSFELNLNDGLSTPYYGTGGGGNHLDQNNNSLFGMDFGPIAKQSEPTNSQFSLAADSSKLMTNHGDSSGTLRRRYNSYSSGNDNPSLFASSSSFSPSYRQQQARQSNGFSPATASQMTASQQDFSEPTFAAAANSNNYNKTKCVYANCNQTANAGKSLTSTCCRCR